MMMSTTSTPTPTPIAQPEWLFSSVLHASATVLAAVAAPWSGKRAANRAESAAAAQPVAMATVGSDGRVCVLSSCTGDSEFAAAALDCRSDFACCAFDPSNRAQMLLGCADGTAHMVQIASNGNFFLNFF
jgi:hypothetical protein